jgi:tetraacyldisaccharide 4'-kinase
MLYMLALALRHFAYDRGWLPVYRAPIPVVSVGNLLAGGTGKTPFVILLARQFPHLKIAILSRGYRGGDEARLLSRKVAHATVYVGKDRCASAQKAAAEGAQLILLDDGMQHRRLHRDVEIALLTGEEAATPLLPFGRRRELLSRLTPAVIQCTRCPPSSPEQIGLETHLSGVLPGPAGLFSGIGRPRQFAESLRSIGVEVVDHLISPDHRLPPLHRLKRFSDKCKALGAKRLICTEKDFVKWDYPLEGLLPIHVAEMQLRVRPDSLSPWEKLIAKIGQTIDNFPYHGQRDKNSFT